MNEEIHYREILPQTNILLFKKGLWVRDYSLKLEKWMNGDKKGPVRIDAEITRRCNLNCIFCSRRCSPIDLNEQSKKIEMTKERWIELARESGELGVKCWNISGIGEPMMRPDVVMGTMKMIKAYDIFGELTTNGTLWNDKYIKEVVESGWESICVSIDGPNAKIHDSLRRVEGTFKKATSTVERFGNWKKKLHSELPSITINMVMNSINYNKLPEMVKLAHNMDANAVFVEPMVMFTNLAEPLRLNEKQIEELPKYIDEARNLGEKYGILPTISSVGVERDFDKELTKNVSNTRKILMDDANKYSDKLLSVPCYYPWLFLMVRTDGSIIPCGELKDVEESVRNKSLRDVWFGEKFEEIRKMFVSKQIPQSCDKCRPNVINDIREIRKAITRFRSVDTLRDEFLELLKENKMLRDQLFFSRKGYHSLKNFEKITKNIESEKELLRYKSSLSYRISKKMDNTSIGRLVKKVFGIYL